MTVTIPLSSIYHLSGHSLPTFQIASYLRASITPYMLRTREPSTSASANYFNSSHLGGFRLLDASMNLLDATFRSESGYDYTRAVPGADVPEPATFGMLTAGAFVFGMVRLRRRA